MRKYLELTASYVIPKKTLDIVEYLLSKYNFKLPAIINKNGVVLAFSLTKLLNMLFKIDNNIGLIVSTYFEQFNKKKRNYFTTLLFFLTLYKKYGKNVKTSYFRVLYIICISRIVYCWSFKKNNINRTFLDFLDKCCGLDKQFIVNYRQEMKYNGWISYNMTCPKGHFYDLILKSFPKSILNVSKVIFYNECVGYIIKKVMGSRYKLELKTKIKNVLFLSLVFQMPIAIASVYNKVYNNSKKLNIPQNIPNTFWIYIWTLCSGLPIVMCDRRMAKNASLFLITSLLSEKINKSIKIPDIMNRYMISNCSEYLLENYETKINNSIRYLLNI